MDKKLGLGRLLTDRYRASKEERAPITERPFFESRWFSASQLNKKKNWPSRERSARGLKAQELLPMDRQEPTSAPLQAPQLDSTKTLNPHIVGAGLETQRASTLVQMDSNGCEWLKLRTWSPLSSGKDLTVNGTDVIWRYTPLITAWISVKKSQFWLSWFIELHSRWILNFRQKQ